MGNSIQDNLKKINRRLSFLDAVSVAITAVFLAACAFYFSFLFREKQVPVTYRSGSAELNTETSAAKPFGSRNGTTYTYSWCQGGNLIKPENKIYYGSEEEARAAGRTLSKLCQK